MMRKEAMLISGKIDQAKLAKLDEETTKLASEVMGEDLKMKREQLALLTPEQIDHLADFSSTKASRPWPSRAAAEDEG
jgi:Spy/CpxP family protein refolding chaperone